MLRVGVASIVQETNTFAATRSTLDDFAIQGLYRGRRAANGTGGSNTELAGALHALEEAGATAVPLLRAWAMSGGVLENDALMELGAMLETELQQAGRLDGLVLSLHGALAADGAEDADAWLLDLARRTLGATRPIGVCLDLHANVTRRLVEASDVLVGYHTYPHVDQAETGARTARLVLRMLDGAQLCTVSAKRPMILPAETTQTTNGQMAALRRLADRLTSGPVHDISIFPVQPWLDVAELGLAVTVSADAAAEADGRMLAEDLAEVAWAMRQSFVIDLVTPDDAIEAARARSGKGPLIVSESADSPTAGATGDSPAVVAALLRSGQGLRAFTTLVDVEAVATCHAAGVGADVDLRIGAAIDTRFHAPVVFAGRIDSVGSNPVRLEGPVYTGMEVSMGRYAVVSDGSLSVLLTERPACTYDPATFRSVGLAPEDADLIAVRSANLFRPGFADISTDVVILDLPGASTPRLETLRFDRAPRPLYPVDRS